MTDYITLHKSDCALLLGGYQCTCGLYQRNSKTLPALAAEQPKPSEDIEALRRENERLREALQGIAEVDLTGCDLTAAGYIAHALIGRAKAALRREET